MVDIREIMQSGNARLERLLEKIANNTKGIYKAANTFILETIDRLADKEIPTEEQVTTTSKLLTAVILEAFNQFRKRNFKAEESDFEEIDMDSEEASDKLFPDSILQDLTKRTIMMLDDVPEEFKFLKSSSILSTSPGILICVSLGILITPFSPFAFEIIHHKFGSP